MIQTLNFAMFAGITSNADVRSELGKQRWKNGFVCPQCGCTKGYVLATRDSIECSACRKQTSSTAGTIFHGIRHLRAFTKILVDFLEGKHKSAAEVAREFGFDVGTAWSYLLKIGSAVMPISPVTAPLEVPSTLPKPALVKRNDDEIQAVIAPENAAKEITSNTILESEELSLSSNSRLEVLHSALMFLLSMFRGVSRRISQLCSAKFELKIQKRKVGFDQILELYMRTKPQSRHEVADYMLRLMPRLADRTAGGSRAPPDNHSQAWLGSNSEDSQVLADKGRCDFQNANEQSGRVRSNEIHSLAATSCH